VYKELLKKRVLLIAKVTEHTRMGDVPNPRDYNKEEDMLNAIAQYFDTSALVGVPSKTRRTRKQTAKRKKAKAGKKSRKRNR